MSTRQLQPVLSGSSLRNPHAADAATWTAPWTAALDMKSRPDNAGVFEYACHEGNHGMSNMLSAARALERTAR